MKMNDYRISYRGKAGTEDWFCKANSADEAEDKFHEAKGYLQINGIYRKGWIAV
jgi:hypothetical protein